MDTLALLTADEQAHSAIGYWLSRSTEADTHGVLHTRLPLGEINRRGGGKDEPLPRQQGTLVALSPESSLGVVFMGDGTGTLVWTEHGSPLIAAIRDQRNAPRGASVGPRLVCSPAPFRFLGVAGVEAVRRTGPTSSGNPHKQRHSLRLPHKGPQLHHPRLLVDTLGRPLSWTPRTGNIPPTPLEAQEPSPIGAWWNGMCNDARAWWDQPASRAPVANLPFQACPRPAWKSLTTPQMHLTRVANPTQDLAAVEAAWPDAACGPDRMGAETLVCGVAFLPNGTSHVLPHSVVLASSPDPRPLHRVETARLLALLGLPTDVDAIAWQESWSSWDGNVHRPRLLRHASWRITAPKASAHAALAIAARIPEMA